MPTMLKMTTLSMFMPEQIEAQVVDLIVSEDEDIIIEVTGKK